MRTALAVALLALPLLAQGPLMTRGPLDMWGSTTFPWFTAAFPHATASQQTAFPGLTPPDSAHTLLIGKRGGGGDWFRDLYIVDQIAGDRVAGLRLGDIEYSTSAVSDSVSHDGLRRTWDDRGVTSWAVDAWYVPRRHRILNGLAIHASDYRSAAYTIRDDSLIDVGWERRVTNSDASTGKAGATFLFAGPRNGHIRANLTFRGALGQSTGWFVPATSDSIEYYEGRKTNSLRLDGSVGYVRHVPSRGRTFLVNAGVHGGGYRASAKAASDSSWMMLKSKSDQMDTLGGFAEAAYTRHVRGERFDIYYGPAAFWHVAFDYTARSSASLAERIRNDQRTDRASIAIPAFARFAFTPRLWAFLAWQPSVEYRRSRALHEWSPNGVRESFSLELAQAAIGVRWAPVDRLQFSLVPSIRDNILSSAFECSIVW